MDINFFETTNVSSNIAKLVPNSIYIEKISEDLVRFYFFDYNSKLYSTYVGDSSSGGGGGTPGNPAPFSRYNQTLVQILEKQPNADIPQQATIDAELLNAFEYLANYIVNEIETQLDAVTGIGDSFQQVLNSFQTLYNIVNNFINDAITSSTTTWSSEKIANAIANLGGGLVLIGSKEELDDMPSGDVKPLSLYLTTNGDGMYAWVNDQFVKVTSDPGQLPNLVNDLVSVYNTGDYTAVPAGSLESNLLSLVLKLKEDKCDCDGGENPGGGGGGSAKEMDSLQVNVVNQLADIEVPGNKIVLIYVSGLGTIPQSRYTFTDGVVHIDLQDSYPAMVTIVFERTVQLATDQIITKDFTFVTGEEGNIFDMGEEFEEVLNLTVLNTSPQPSVYWDQVGDSQINVYGDITDGDLFSVTCKKKMKLAGDLLKIEVLQNTDYPFMTVQNSISKILYVETSSQGALEFSNFAKDGDKGIEIFPDEGGPGDWITVYYNTPNSVGDLIARKIIVPYGRLIIFKAYYNELDTLEYNDMVIGLWENGRFVVGLYIGGDVTQESSFIWGIDQAMG